MDTSMRITAAIVGIAFLAGCGFVEDDGPDGGPRQISAGAKHVCATLQGDVFCWGETENIRVGKDIATDAISPIKVQADGQDISPLAIAAGTAHTCSGAGYASQPGGIGCWGKADRGQLGRGSTRYNALPMPGIEEKPKAQADPNFDDPVIDVAAGRAHSCAVLLGGDIRCWGSDKNNQIGTGFPPNSSKDFQDVQELFEPPTRVRSIGSANDPDRDGEVPGAVAISAGGDTTCALLEDGTIYCWGANPLGTIGSGIESKRTLVPNKVEGITNATDISVGGFHACAALESGEAKCWGSDLEGQLGNGTGRSSSTPVTVKSTNFPNLFKVIDIAAGDEHTCAVVAQKFGEEGDVLFDRSVFCWGSDAFGALGNGKPVGSIKGSSKVPVEVDGFGPTTEEVAGVAAGSGFSCVFLRRTGKNVECWGKGKAGQLGNGSAQNSPVPVQVNFSSP